MDNKKFSSLCSRAWSLPVLALLAEGHTARVSPVAHALDAGRTPISTTFAHLVEMNLLARNQGHGHPLRPEFALTDLGQITAQWALGLRDKVNDHDDWQLLRRSWTLPVLRLTDDASRYALLRSSLAPITDRALSLSLKAMQNRGWLDREVTTEYMPPQVCYVATGPGRILMPGLRQSFELR